MQTRLTNSKCNYVPNYYIQFHLVTSITHVLIYLLKLHMKWGSVVRFKLLSIAFYLLTHVYKCCVYYLNLSTVLPQLLIFTGYFIMVDKRPSKAISEFYCVKLVF